MVKLSHKILVFILFFTLLSPTVYAISLGSIAKDKFAEITSDESVKLKMLFWNTESEPYTVKLSVEEAPQDWVVILDPAEFVLSKYVGEEYINLPYIDEKIMAKIVNVYVKADEKSQIGKYFVVIKAETLEQNDGNNIIVVPERLFKFEINLKTGLSEISNADSIYLSETFDSNHESPKNNGEQKSKQNYLNFFVMSMVLLFLIIIYKKS